MYGGQRGVKMKVITMYLPQFHRVKENDEWWGAGFTEWTAVKGAAPLFEGHDQPRVPLHENYYDLLDKRTMQWQAGLMKKYGVDGQCIYHYWFKDGRKILEKPAENLLQWKDIDMPFCFCWANESWARTWSKLRPANVWMVTDNKKEGNEQKVVKAELLIEQAYGDEKQWRIHFDYLLPFFKDDRYIRIEKKPVFVIYQSAQISCLGEMLDCWNRWSREAGMEGIYIIGANSDARSNRWLDGLLQHEPQFSIGQVANCKWGDLVKTDYDRIWKALLERYSYVPTTFYGGFVGYDSTPRCGDKGIIIENDNPIKFRNYLSELLAKNAASGRNIVFVNAGKEWGEGMYLEPDKKYEYGYLEAILYAKEHYKEYMTKYKKDTEKENQFLKRELEIITEKTMRYQGYWGIMDAWLTLKENDISIIDFFRINHIKSINIYGIGMLGQHLIKELENQDIEIVGLIDRNAQRAAKLIGAGVYLPEDQLPESDMIVVTVDYAYEDIRRQLHEKGYRNIISLRQVIEKLGEKLCDM